VSFASDPRMNCCACGRRYQGSDYNVGRSFPDNSCQNGIYRDGVSRPALLAEDGQEELINLSARSKTYPTLEESAGFETNILIGGLGLMALVTLVMYKKSKPSKRDTFELVKESETIDTQMKA